MNEDAKKMMQELELSVVVTRETEAKVFLDAADVAAANKFDASRDYDGLKATGHIVALILAATACERAVSSVILEADPGVSVDSLGPVTKESVRSMLNKALGKDVGKDYPRFTQLREAVVERNKTVHAGFNPDPSSVLDHIEEFRSFVKWLNKFEDEVITKNPHP